MKRFTLLSIAICALSLQPAFAVPVTYQLSAVFSTGQSGYYPKVYGPATGPNTITGFGSITLDFQAGQFPQFSPTEKLSASALATQYLSVLEASQVTSFSFAIGNKNWELNTSTLLPFSAGSGSPSGIYFAADQPGLPPKTAQIGFGAKNDQGDILYFDRLGCAFGKCTVGSQEALVDLAISTIQFNASSSTAELASPVPEPHTALLLPLGMIAIAYVRRRYRPD